MAQKPSSCLHAGLACSRSSSSVARSAGPARKSEQCSEARPATSSVLGCSPNSALPQRSDASGGALQRASSACHGSRAAKRGSLQPAVPPAGDADSAAAAGGNRSSRSTLRCPVSRRATASPGRRGLRTACSTRLPNVLTAAHESAASLEPPPPPPPAGCTRTKWSQLWLRARPRPVPAPSGATATCRICRPAGRLKPPRQRQPPSRSRPRSASESRPSPDALSSSAPPPSLGGPKARQLATQFPANASQRASAAAAFLSSATSSSTRLGGAAAPASVMPCSMRSRSPCGVAESPARAAAERASSRDWPWTTDTPRRSSLVPAIAPAASAAGGRPSGQRTYGSSVCGFSCSGSSACAADHASLSEVYDRPIGLR
mmetsp:Transcript_22509/g.75970  ORF Transcript_22509/g.75970 Transcript_22509/m.75970 type:complete len:374 (-) Transcript_22509:182-1303(-)